MQFDRIVEIFGLWPHYIVASLVVPIVVGALARNIVLMLCSALLSLLSLTLLFDPSSTGPALAVSSAIGSFLIALASLIERRRIVALNTQIGELIERLATLEAAESRRLAIEVRTKTRDASHGLAKDTQRTADSPRSPSLSVARLSEFSPTRETS
jgi:hypothetical protein